MNVCISKKYHTVEMSMFGVLFLLGTILWLVLFLHACCDMYHTYKRINSTGENELVNWTVHDYGTCLTAEYGEDGL